MMMRFGTIASQIKKMDDLGEIKWLYKDGNEYAENTGGWVYTKQTAGSQVFTKYADRMTFYLPQWSDGMLSTVNNVDRTGFKVLCVEWEISGGSGSYVTWREEAGTDMIMMSSGVNRIPSVSIRNVAPELKKLVFYISNTNNRTITLRKIWLQKFVPKGQQVYTDDYLTNPLGTRLIAGTGTWAWDAGGFVKQTATTNAFQFAYQKGAAYSSILGTLEVEADFTMLSDPSGRKHAGFLIESSDIPATGLRCVALDGKFYISSWNAGVESGSVGTASAIGALPTGVTQKLKVKVNYNTGLIEMFLDGVLKLSATNLDHRRGRPGFFCYGGSVKIDNLVYKYT